MKLLRFVITNTLYVPQVVEISLSQKEIEQLQNDSVVRTTLKGRPILTLIVRKEKEPEPEIMTRSGFLPTSKTEVR